MMNKMTKLVIRGYPWLFVIHGYLSLFMVIQGYSCICGYSWLLVVIRRNSWLLVVIRGNPWLFVVIRGYSWLYMVTHGYSCTKFTLLILIFRPKVK